MIDSKSDLDVREFETPFVHHKFEREQAFSLAPEQQIESPFLAEYDATSAEFSEDEEWNADIDQLTVIPENDDLEPTAWEQKFEDELINEIAEFVEPEIVDEFAAPPASLPKIIPSPTPTPDRFYRVRKGDSLLKIAGTAYKKKVGSVVRLQCAQLINRHPFNWRYHIPAKKSFTKKHFPEGIISFYPRVSCVDADFTKPEQFPPKGKCYPLVIIPLETDIWLVSPAEVTQPDRFKCWAAAILSWSRVTTGTKKFKSITDVIDMFRKLKVKMPLKGGGIAEEPLVTKSGALHRWPKVEVPAKIDGKKVTVPPGQLTLLTVATRLRLNLVVKDRELTLADVVAILANSHGPVIVLKFTKGIGHGTVIFGASPSSKIIGEMDPFTVPAKNTGPAYGSHNTRWLQKFDTFKNDSEGNAWAEFAFFFKKKVKTTRYLPEIDAESADSLFVAYDADFSRTSDYEVSQENAEDEAPEPLTIVEETDPENAWEEDLIESGEEEIEEEAKSWIEENLESELIDELYEEGAEELESSECSIDELDEEGLDTEFEYETNDGTSSTKERVKWYQAILKNAAGYSEIPIDGNHNNRATRNALKDFQQKHGITRKDGYLSVETNYALTQMALQSVYKEFITNPFGKLSNVLKEQIKRFQHEYGLGVDGKVGPKTRRKMVDILTGKTPRPRRFPDVVIKNESSEAEYENVDVITTDRDYGIDSELGVIRKDDREPEKNTLIEPNRWICRIAPNFECTKVTQNSRNGGLTSSACENVRSLVRSIGGTGTLISPRHVLTAGHVLSQNSPKQPEIFLRAVTVRVFPAYNGIFGLFGRRAVKSPYGEHPGKEDTPYRLLGCYEKTFKGIVHGFDEYCDLALIELDTPVEFLAPSFRRRVKGKSQLVELPPLGYWGQTPEYQIHSPNNVPPSGTEISTIGYPTKIPHHATTPKRKDLQWKATGKLNHEVISLGGFGRQYYVHNADTTDGQSGSPVWIERSINGKAVKIMIGIVVRAGVTENHALAFTSSVLQEIQSWAPETFTFKNNVLSVIK